MTFNYPSSVPPLSPSPTPLNSFVLFHHSWSTRVKIYKISQSRLYRLCAIGKEFYGLPEPLTFHHQINTSERYHWVKFLRYLRKSAPLALQISYSLSTLCLFLNQILQSILCRGPLTIIYTISKFMQYAALIHSHLHSYIALSSSWFLLLFV
jgi:hypothetical protein